MSKANIDKEKLLKKFKTLSVASDCIQKTSKYLYQFYKSSDTIVNVWLQALNTVSSDSARISLFYIANEMLQSKNYGSSYFKQSWKPHLTHSIDCIKDSTVNDKIRRILNIWIERNVYEKSFVDDLIHRLSKSKTSTVNDDHCKEVIMNFDPDEALEKLKELISAENRTTEILKEHESAMNFDEKICKDQIKKLKDKNHCNQFSDNLDGNINHLFHICTVLEEELKVRQNAIEAMTNADIYYETQQKETLIVEDAYRRYGNLILKTKDAIEEHLEFLMEDGGPVDIDDAPSPGNTPPYLYDETFKHVSTDSPESYDAVSPSQSMDMSEDDTPMDKSSYLDKAYSPSYEIRSSKAATSEPQTSLSSTEALQLLTSVFSQSLAPKSFPEINTKVNLQPDIFRNTLTTPVKISSEEVKTSDKTVKSDTVFADAFRLISNLTGLKNIGERTLKSDSSNTGSIIPTLTSNSSMKSPNEDSDLMSDSFLNHQNGSNVQIFSHQSSGNNSSMFPSFNNVAVPPPPMPAMFGGNQLSFNLASMTQVNQQSPGSCTDDDDDGSATPTQDEPGLSNPTVPPPMFIDQNAPPGTEELNKQIQNVMSVCGNTFGLPNLLSVSSEQPSNNQLPWNNMPGQFPFTMTNAQFPPPPVMNIPFSLMNANPQIQAPFHPINSAMPTFGPPRAIRTKRPNESTSANDQTMEVNDESLVSSQTPPPPPPPPPQQRPQSATDIPSEDIQPTVQTNNNSVKSNQNMTVNDSDLINLYGDVEEELDRNYNVYQQSINVRSSRPAGPMPPMDRYHLYNNQSMPMHQYPQRPPPPLPPVAQHQQMPPRMIYGHNINNYPRQQFQPRSAGHHLPYYPNRTTNFRPRNNYNMFN